jgi:hypothetical protein
MKRIIIDLPELVMSRSEGETQAMELRSKTVVSNAPDTAYSLVEDKLRSQARVSQAVWSSQPRRPEVLIATRSFGSASPKPFEVLTEAGFYYTRADMSQEMTEAGLVELLRGISEAVVGLVALTARVLADAPSWWVISIHGIGTDRRSSHRYIRICMSNRSKSD